MKLTLQQRFGTRVAQAPLGAAEWVAAWGAPLLFALLTFGCDRGDRSQADAPPGNGSTEAPSEEAPPVVAGGARCLISADCPVGAHCDLGECVQRCNEAEPCTGELACSPRGRCLELGVIDAEPTPTTERTGTVLLAPGRAELGRGDAHLRLTLTSDADTPVSYRVQVDGDYLSIEAPRGEFTGSTTLELDVDPSAATRDASASVKVYTDLGEVVAFTTLHQGLAGRYQGAFRYTSGATHLGDARAVLELAQSGEEVTVLVDPEGSLLFPATPTGVVGGFGLHVEGQPLEVVIAQRIPTDLAGERNHFGRELGRSLALSVLQSAPGVLEGTFTETVHGLFAEPVSLGGSVRLQYVGDVEALAASPVTATMPVAPSVAVPADPDAFVPAPSNAGVLTGSPAQLLSSCHRPLLDALAAPAANYSSIAADCEAALGGASSTPRCGSLWQLYRASYATTQNGAASTNNVRNAGGLLQALVAPGTLIAQDRLVRALRDSFDGATIDAELAHYDAASAALAPATRWLLQPALLQFLRDAGATDGGATVALAPTFDNAESFGEPYPIPRALGRQFSVSSLLDGERTRILAYRPALAHSERLADAQQRSLVTYLEAVALLGVLDDWTHLDDDTRAQATASVSGVLTPLDNAYASLLAGPIEFGVPAGYVPFVYSADRLATGPTNFHQRLAQAGTVLALEKNSEDAFRDSAEALDQVAYQTSTELLSLNAEYDDQLEAYCGEGYSAENITDPEELDTCGACGADFDPNLPPEQWIPCGGGGVAELRNALLLAQARWNASLARLGSMHEKTAIDQTTLATTQGIGEDLLRFTARTGEQLSAITLTQGIFATVQSSLAIASNAQVFNGGAPVGMAAMNAVFGALNTSLDVARQDLETAQTMKVQETALLSAQVEGLAEIQKQTIDAAQFGLEIVQDVYASREAAMRLVNTLAEVRRLLDNRRQAYALQATDPAQDPSLRIVRDRSALSLLGRRFRAQQELYLAGRALELELNRNLPELGAAVTNARTADRLEDLELCLAALYDAYSAAYSSEQDYSTDVSVREMMGIRGPRVDEATGQELSPGEQFRLYVLKNQNLDDEGGVTLRFATDLMPGNGLWSTGVCNDRIASVEVQLVGDFLGDNQATVQLGLSGAGFMRACTEESLRQWDLLGEKRAELQAGVNSFGIAPPNDALFGQPVARASWVLTIPGSAAAPANADLDLGGLEDIVVRIAHRARAIEDGSFTVAEDCLARAAAY